MSLRMKELSLTIIALIILVLLVASAHAQQTYNPVSSDPTSRNTAVGTAGVGPKSGAYNTTVGNNAGWQIVTGGQDNTLLGYRAGFSATTGSENTAVGSEALGANQTGSYNTAIGGVAGPSINGPASKFNTYVGWGAGGGHAAGHDTIYIGANAVSANESNLIRIGKPGVHTQVFLSGVYNTKRVGKVVVVTAAGQFAESSVDLFALVQQMQSQITALQAQVNALQQ